MLVLAALVTGMKTVLEFKICKVHRVHNCEFLVRKTRVAQLKLGMTLLKV